MLDLSQGQHVLEHIIFLFLSFCRITARMKWDPNYKWFLAMTMNHIRVCLLPRLYIGKVTVNEQSELEEVDINEEKVAELEDSESSDFGGGSEELYDVVSVRGEETARHWPRNWVCVACEPVRHPARMQGKAPAQITSYYYIWICS